MHLEWVVLVVALLSEGVLLSVGALSPLEILLAAEYLG
jgi:hypothetical protein